MSFYDIIIGTAHCLKFAVMFAFIIAGWIYTAANREAELDVIH